MEGFITNKNPIRRSGLSLVRWLLLGSRFFLRCENVILEFQIGVDCEDDGINCQSDESERVFLGDGVDARNMDIDHRIGGICPFVKFAPLKGMHLFADFREGRDEKREHDQKRDGSCRVECAQCDDHQKGGMGNQEHETENGVFASDTHQHDLGFRFLLEGSGEHDQDEEREGHMALEDSLIDEGDAFNGFTGETDSELCENSHNGRDAHQDSHTPVVLVFVFMKMFAFEDDEKRQWNKNDQSGETE